jgi:hypothetical protein
MINLAHKHDYTEVARIHRISERVFKEKFENCMILFFGKYRVYFTYVNIINLNRTGRMK